MRPGALEHLMSGQLEAKRNLQVSTFDAHFYQLIPIGRGQFIMGTYGHEGPHSTVT